MSAGSASTPPKRHSSKPKGAVRAKSGCYTCRIRRKKCDEKPDADGQCQTCVRLRLQCLGFGAKRPEWMREGNSVAELRSKIKGFLAQNGMIKGHSASGALRSPGAESAPGASTSSAPRTSVSLPPLHNVAPGASEELNTPLSPTSTLTPERGSASPPTTAGSHVTSNPYIQDRSFSPGYAHVSTRPRYDSLMNGTEFGSRHAGLDQLPTSPSGVLHLSDGRPIPSRIPTHNPASRHPRRPSHGGNSGGTDYSQHGLGLITMDDSMGPFSADGHDSTLVNPSYHAPQLSPDSPPPTYRPDPIIGGTYSTPVQMSEQGHGQPSVSVAYHLPGQFNVHSTQGRQSGHGGSGQSMHNYGHDHGHGQTASWAGDDHVRLGGHQQPQGHLFQPQLQHNQAQVQLQASYASIHGNNSNDSGTLHFPDASPTVRRTDLPPPNMCSSFGSLYNFNYMSDDFGVNELDSTFQAQHTQMNGIAVNGVGGGALMPYYAQSQAPISELDFSAQPPEQQQAMYQHYAVAQPLQPALMDPLFVDRGDGLLVEHYLHHVRPVQYFFWDERLVDLLRNLAIDNEAVRNAICSVASVHKRRMREGSMGLRGNSPPSPPRRVITAGAGDAPEGDDDNAYHNRTKHALDRAGTDKLTKAEAMAGLQCISSFLFAGGTGGWQFFLNVACSWVNAVIGLCRRLGDAYLLHELTCMKREDELGSFIVRTTMWFEVLGSVTTVSAPKFLEVYRKLFALTDGAQIVEVDGVTPAMEPEFSMLEVMGCDNLTFLALAEISALAAWKDEETKHQTLSSVELVRRGFDIEGRYLQAISRTGSNTSQERSGAMADSLENRRRLTADIFRASARLYLHTVLSGDKPSVREIREGVSETLNALMRVPNDPKPLRRSVVRSVVFPICLAGCMTDDRTERDAFRKVLDCEGGAGNCTSVVEVMEIVWQRRDAAYNAQKRRSGRRPVEHVDDVNWRDVLKEHGGGVPILLV